MALIAGGNDFICRSFSEEAGVLNCTNIVFRWDINSRSVIVRHPKRDANFESDLLLEGVVNMRSEVKTWPREILKSVHALSTYLGLEDHQLSQMQQA